MFQRLLPFFACLMIASLALAEPQTLTLKNGQKITGDVIRTATGYQLKDKNGVVTEFSAEDVAAVAPAVDMQKEYQARLAKIDPNSAAAHMDIARWAMDNKETDTARKELQAVLKLDPSNERARLMLRQIAPSPAAEAETPAKEGEKSPEAAAGKEQPAAKELVSDDDIYKIRIVELKRNEPIQAEFRNKVLDRFIDRMKGFREWKAPNAEREFRALSRWQQVSYILDNIDSDDTAIRNDILILKDPRTIREFRTQILPTVDQYCGQVLCHGSAKGKGGFKLFNTRTEKADYTNFVILSLWEKNSRKMIDRGHNELSLLLQYGLPQDQAQIKHPKEVPAMFQNMRSPVYRRFVQWIGSLEGSKQPNYHISYQPPVGLKLVQGGAGLGTTAPAATSAPADELFKK